MNDWRYPEEIEAEEEPDDPRIKDDSARCDCGIDGCECEDGSCDCVVA